MVFNGLVQAPNKRLHQTIENHSESMKLYEITNLTGWLTAQALELPNISHFRLQCRRKCQAFMPSGTCKAERVKHVSVLAHWPSTGEPPNHTTSQSASQEDPLPLAGRLPGCVCRPHLGATLDECFTLLPPHV